jgi:hypothetical protein
MTPRGAVCAIQSCLTEVIHVALLGGAGVCVTFASSNVTTPSSRVAGSSR